MEKRRIGNTELEASVVGFGCWPLSGGRFWTDHNDSDSLDAISTAVDYGVNFFDVAPVYGFGHAEEILGKAIKGRRDRVIIATKCGLVWDDNYNISNLLSKESIRREIDDSLRRLGTDYIDIYQLHWPDCNTPLEVALETMNELRMSGKIRYTGISNFPARLMKEAVEYSGVVSQQCLYNMLDRNEDYYHGIPLYYHTEDDILPLCKEHNIAFFPYSPLCQGLLTGRFKDEGNFEPYDVRSNNPNLSGEKLKMRLKIVEGLKEVCERIKKPLNQVAINWLVNNPAITSVICGAKDRYQAEQNALAGFWTMDNGAMEKVNSILD